MKEIVKVLLAEGIDEETIHEVLDVISESLEEIAGQDLDDAEEKADKNPSVANKVLLKKKLSTYSKALKLKDHKEIGPEDLTSFHPKTLKHVVSKEHEHVRKDTPKHEIGDLKNVYDKINFNIKNKRYVSEMPQITSDKKQQRKAIDRHNKKLGKNN